MKSISMSPRILLFLLIATFNGWMSEVCLNPTKKDVLFVQISGIIMFLKGLRLSPSNICHVFGKIVSIQKKWALVCPINLRNKEVMTFFLQFSSISALGLRPRKVYHYFFVTYRIDNSKTKKNKLSFVHLLRYLVR